MAGAWPWSVCTCGHEGAYHDSACSVLGCLCGVFTQDLITPDVDEIEVRETKERA